jgi:hypothetical protein
MPVLADPGYEGAGHGVHVPVKKAAGSKNSTLIPGPQHAAALVLVLFERKMIA